MKARNDRGLREGTGQFSLLALVSVLVSGSSVTAESLSVDQAISLALRNSETIVIQREGLASAGEAVIGTKGVYDPLLEIDAGWRRVTEPVNSAFSGAPDGEPAPTDETAEAGVGVSQYLPTGGTVFLNASASRATTDGIFTFLTPAYWTQLGVEYRQPLLRDRSIDAARVAMQVAGSDRSGAAASLRTVVNLTIAGVELAYWSLVEALGEVEVLDESVRLAEEQLEETMARVETGMAPETEIAQPRAEIERRRGERLAAIESVSRAENLLKVLILNDQDGSLWLERIEPSDDPSSGIIPVDAEAAMNRGLDTRPEVAEAAALVERRRAESAFARDGVRPTLDAVLSYDRFGLAGSENPDAVPALGLTGIPPEEGDLGTSFSTLRDGDFDDARVALVFGIPLGNRAAQASAASAVNAERQAEAELARVRKRIRAEVLNAVAALETAGQRIEAARAARVAAEVQLESEQDRYGVGLSTNFLVLTRQNDLSRARLDEIGALTDYRTAQADLGRATGSLAEDRGVVIEENQREEN